MTEKQIPDQPGWKDRPNETGYWWWLKDESKWIMYVETRFGSNLAYYPQDEYGSDAEKLGGKWFGPLQPTEPPHD